MGEQQCSFDSFICSFVQLSLDHRIAGQILVNMDIVLAQIADPVGEALQFLRMSGIFYCRSEFTAPWALALPPMKNCLMLHVVTSGRRWLEVDGTSRCFNQAIWPWCRMVQATRWRAKRE